jgi:hypothetical protein
MKKGATKKKGGKIGRRITKLPQIDNIEALKKKYSCKKCVRPKDK